MSELRHLRQTLRDATTRKEAAYALLDHGRDVLLAAFVGAVVPRALVHLRSEAGGYTDVHVREWTRKPSAAPDVAPSATAFALVLRERCALGIDVRAVRGERLADATPVDVSIAVSHGDPKASVHQIIARGATHVVALPLVAAGGEIVGMATFEATWPDEIGKGFPPGSYRSELELACDLATPRLTSLPSSTEPEPTTDPLLPVVGNKLGALLPMLRVFAAQDETLLVSGPTGAGKSRLAAWCHARSPRHSQPFETANLLALPENLQLAELFGWKKGAFTGAQGDHDGLVAAADGGTLFLDEIDKLSLGAQAGLLRFLETRLYLPLGAPKERSANVRVIVGTNADLRALVRSGGFREDLFYRIHVLPVHLPPLAERTDEIDGWARAMLERRHAEAHGPGGRVRLDEDAVDPLLRHPWPGNLRQLDNVMRRAYALALADPRHGIDKVVSRRHVESALLPELGTTTTDLPRSSTEELLLAVADRIVDEALEARRRGKTLRLTDLEVMRGLVLKTAADRVGSVKDAFLLLGGDALVESRNHQREFRRELAALEGLLAGLPSRAKR